LFRFRFWIWRVCVDEVPVVTPYGLKAALEPGEFTVKGVV
jgi:hypothetical protein